MEDFKEVVDYFQYTGEGEEVNLPFVLIVFYVVVIITSIVSHTSKYSLDEKGKHKRGNNDMKQTEDGKRLRKIRQLLNDKLVEMWAKFFKTNKP